MRMWDHDVLKQKFAEEGMGKFCFGFFIYKVSISKNFNISGNRQLSVFRFFLQKWMSVDLQKIGFWI